MIIIIGKSGSGKTTLINKLCNEYGFRRIVTTTTRPIRYNERQDVDYHFVSVDEFKQLEEKSAFVESQYYRVASGDVWHYGTSFSSIMSSDDKDVVILTPKGCKQVKNCCKGKNYTVIYVDADNNILKHRLMMRGDDNNEIERRMSKDNEDFKGAEKLADLIIKNNEDDAELFASKVARMLIDNSSVPKEVYKMEPLKIYLAGACKDIPDEGAKWREEATKKLHAISKWTDKPIDVFNPIDYFKYSASNYKTPKQVKTYYMSQLKKCDLVLVNLNKTNNSVGTGQECQYAVDHEIPIIGFGDTNSYSWISEVDCDVVFETMSVAIDYIKDYYLQ